MQRTAKYQFHMTDLLLLKLKTLVTNIHIPACLINYLIIVIKDSTTRLKYLLVFLITRGSIILPLRGSLPV